MVLLIFFYVMLIGIQSSLSINPFPVYQIKEVKFTGGVPGASYYLNGDWRPEKAFMQQYPVDNGWHVGPVGEPSRNPPVSVWYDFKTMQIRPDHVSLQPAQSGAALQGAPSSYQFIGSNDQVCDDSAKWTILCEDLSDKAWRSHFEVRYCKVRPEITEKFRCLGIRALKNHRPDGYTSIRNIRIWERIEESNEEL